MTQVWICSVNKCLSSSLSSYSRKQTEPFPSPPYEGHEKHCSFPIYPIKWVEFGLLGDLCSILSSAKDVPNGFEGGSLFSPRLPAACNTSTIILPRMHQVLQYYCSTRPSKSSSNTQPGNDPITPLTLCRNSSFSPLFTSLYV